MVRELMHDPLFLARKSTAPTAEDLPIARDLMDTLLHHREGCVGMAANMIGVRKRIIVVSMGMLDVAMVNPVILSKFGPYEAEEGCLSLAGVRKTTRYREIEVAFQDASFRPQKQKYAGWIAQIIQHEIDHCEGKLI